MFRQASGFKAQYGPLTLLVASDFDEWRIFLHRPGVVIQAGRQFSEPKAKEQARTVADSYLDEAGEAAQASEPEWTPIQPGEWLNWRP